MKHVLPFVFIALTHICFAQNVYEFSTYTEPYTEITGGTLMQTYDYGNNHWDDPDFSVPLYGFQIGQQSYDSITQFGVGCLMAFSGNEFMPDHIFGLDIDIIDPTIQPGFAPSEISYISYLTPESSKTIIQFKNVAFYEEIMGDAEPTDNNRMNFQLWFETPSNAMSIHFGPSTIPDPGLIFYDGGGPTVLLATDVNFINESAGYIAILKGDPGNPAVQEFINAPLPEEYDVLTGVPAENRVYRFAPVSSGLSAIDEPSFSIYPTLTAGPLHVKGLANGLQTFRVFNIAGKEVKTGRLTSGETLNVSELESGFYTLSIEGYKKAVKFIRQ